MTITITITISISITIIIIITTIITIITYIKHIKQYINKQNATYIIAIQLSIIHMIQTKHMLHT